MGKKIKPHSGLILERPQGFWWESFVSEATSSCDPVSTAKMVSDRLAMALCTWCLSARGMEPVPHEEVQACGGGLVNEHANECAKAAGM